jgi:DNA polymerase-3 subunit epsilon
VNALRPPWWEGPLAPFDLESTGIDTREARIVTGFVATLAPKAQRRKMQPGAKVIVNPGVPIPAEAARIHGVTDEIARAKGMPPEAGVYAIVKALHDSLRAGVPVIGMNLSYDFSLLYWECLRHGVPTVAELMGYPPDAPVGPIIDVLVLDKHFDQYRKGSRKLDDDPVKGPGLATRYGVPLTAAHTSDADALASAQVGVKIAEKYQHDHDMLPDAGALHQLQKLWATDQRQSLQRHFRIKKNNPTLTLDPCWPQCTNPGHPA